MIETRSRPIGAERNHACGKRSFFIAMAMGLAAPAYAQDDEGGRSRLAVIDLEANGVPAELARALTESVATRLDRSGVFETVSPVQLAAVVSLDKSRWATGACDEEDCFARLARAVQAKHAIGGSVSRAGETFAVQLVLVDVDSAGALRRVQRESGAPSELISAASAAAAQLVQPILQERSGFVRVDANVPGVQLVVDGERAPHRAGQVFSLAAGPHVVKASMDGFYPSVVDINVRPGRVTPAQLTLVPAAETVRAHEGQANLLRGLAWTTAGVAVASTVASVFFYDQASGNLDVINRYVEATDIERAGQSRPTDDQSAFDTNQGLYLTFLGTAVVSGLTSAGLFLFGPDPGRFSEFEDLSEE